jgi:hypothetical protein
MILAFGRDSDVLRVLHDFYDQPELGTRIAKDPRSFFEEQGVRLPDGATVTVTSEPERSAIEARFVTATLEYRIGWSRDRGFYVFPSREDAHVASD